MNAGTSVARTMVASITTATARPRPKSLMMDTPDVANATKVMAGIAEFLAAHCAAVRAGNLDVISKAVADLCGRPAQSWRTLLDSHPDRTHRVDASFAGESLGD